MPYSTLSDIELSKKIAKRSNDWRIGAVVYQVLVDRFAPSNDLENKRHLYPSPKKIMSWQQTPKLGKYLETERLWSHEVEFWGGDLNALSGRLGYILELGVDILYLNPIHFAYTNHKYDSLDFDLISPEFGTRDDLIKLIDNVHHQGLKIVLDGVFNHMGQNSEKFVSASNDKSSSYRGWFYLSEQYPQGHRAWANAVNLPELNLENIEVRNSLYLDADSTVKRYLNDGIDGWRLDVAHDIGFNFLSELTQHAHEAKEGSLVIGEVWSYPKQWLESVDGIMNLTLRHIIIQTCIGNISASLASRQIQQMVDESDYEGLLMSWLLLDNHDTVRLANILPGIEQRQLAQVMQFTLPGSPNLYYGSELGMTGGDDPEMRAPMRWDLVDEKNDNLLWIKKLITLRKKHTALKNGDFKIIATEKLIAYLRYTDKVEDACIVVINPSKHKVTEQLMVPYSKLMNMGEFIEVLGKYPEPLKISASFLSVNMPAQCAAIFKPNVKPVHGYTTYKRVR